MSEAELDPRHAVFVDAWLETGDPVAAAKRAGFAGTYGHALTRRPDVKAAAQARVTNEALAMSPEALRTLRNIAVDFGSPAAARVAAARAVLETAGIGAKAASVTIHASTAHVDVTALSAADLERMANQIAADRAASESDWRDAKPAPSTPAVFDVDWALVPPPPSV